MFSYRKILAVAATVLSDGLHTASSITELPIKDATHTHTHKHKNACTHIYKHRAYQMYLLT